MSHQHQWYVAQHLLLSLPDTEGFAERSTQWRCRTCPMDYEIDGYVKFCYPLMSPEFWQQVDPGSPVQTTRQGRAWIYAQRR